MENGNKTKAGKEVEDGSSIQRISISKLIFDDRNVNLGTDAGKEVISNSISRYGIGRGVLVDKNMKLIAGNHAVQEIKDQGYDEIIVVPTNGKQLVVTQRTDIDKDSYEGHGLAIADNQATKENLLFDMELMGELNVEFDLELDDFHIDFDEDTQDSSEQMEDKYARDEDDSHGEYKDDARVTNNSVPVMAALTKAEHLRYTALKKRLGTHTDTETIVQMVELLTT